MKATRDIKRPAMRYYGGKFRLAPWIISYFPSHKVYVEPYGGAASVLLQKPISWGEVYNDLDGEIVNVFRVLRDPGKARELIHMLNLTPYSREEFNSSYEKSPDPVEQARRTIYRAMAGYSSDSATRNVSTGFRSISSQFSRIKSTAQEWCTFPENLENIARRLKAVVIENMPSLDLINLYDRPETLLYVDPPYLHETRYTAQSSKPYRHEMTQEDHIRLAERLNAADAMVIVSGYPHELYDYLYAGWYRVETQSRGQSGKGNGSKMNTEVLWISPNARKDLPLFQQGSIDAA